MGTTTALERARKPLARCSWLVLAVGLAMPTPAATAKIGAPAPAFSLERLDGKAVNSNALRGKVVLLDFWASWCAPCIAAMPAVAKLQRDYGRRGLVVLGVTLDDDNAKLKAFLARRSPGVTVVKPTPSFNRDYGTLLHLKGNRLVTPDKLIQANLPTWILIDRKRRIASTAPSSTLESRCSQKPQRSLPAHDQDAKSSNIHSMETNHESLSRFSRCRACRVHQRLVGVHRPVSRVDPFHDRAEDQQSGQHPGELSKR